MRLYLLLLLLVAAASPLPAEGLPKQQKLLADMKRACGGNAWDKVMGWHEKSIAEIAGMPPIQNEVWHSMRALKSSMVSSVGGQIVRRTGYDGKVAWRSGPDGQIATVTDKNELRRQRRDAYLSSFGWFFPKRFPAKFMTVSQESYDGQSFLTIGIEPRDAEPLVLWIDPSTKYVRRIVAGSEYAELSDYKFFGGVCTATVGTQGDTASDRKMVLRVVDVQTDMVAPSSAFEPAK